MRELSDGESFHHLTVMFRDYEYEDALKNTGKRVRPFYRCKCDCGNETTVVVYDLLRENTKSCGCLKKKAGAKLGSKRRINLTGAIINNLRVIGIDASCDTGPGKHIHWVCECLKCGNTKSIRSSELTSGIVQDCGCGKVERYNNGQLNALSGMVFGNLTVIERDSYNSKRNGTHARWVCRCELCGNVESISSEVLTRYGKDRCTRCMKLSVGEEKICDLLTEAGVSFVRNRAYADCKFEKTGWALRFDFIVNNFDGQSVYMIEFDGIQHFKKVPHWDGKIDYVGRVERDEAKNRWCKEHGIPLIRIPYTHLKDLNINDLTPSLTEFLI